MVHCLHITFQFFLVKKLCKADSEIGVGQIWIPFPFNGFAEWPAVVKLEALIGEVDWQGDDKSQKEKNKKSSEEKIRCQIVPFDSVDLSDGRIVEQPLVSDIKNANNPFPAIKSLLVLSTCEQNTNRTGAKIEIELRPEICSVFFGLA